MKKKIKAVRVKPQIKVGDICIFESVFTVLFSPAFVITKIHYDINNIDNLVFDGIWIGSGTTISSHSFDRVKKIGHTDLIPWFLQKIAAEFEESIAVTPKG